MNLKNYFQRKLGYRGTTKKVSKGSPMASTNQNAMVNMTTVVGRSPRDEVGPGTLTARSGQFARGSMRIRTNPSDRLPGDNLAKEFAVLRGETGENPLDSLNNTIDVADFHYQTTRPSQHKPPRFTSQEDVVVTSTGRSLPDQQGVTGIIKTETEEGAEAKLSLPQAHYKELIDEI